MRTNYEIDIALYGRGSQADMKQHAGQIVTIGTIGRLSAQ